VLVQFAPTVYTSHVSLPVVVFLTLKPRPDDAAFDAFIAKRAKR
jgi:hypothetical protein